MLTGKIKIFSSQMGNHVFSVDCMKDIVKNTKEIPIQGGMLTDLEFIEEEKAIYAQVKLDIAILVKGRIVKQLEFENIQPIIIEFTPDHGEVLLKQKKT